MSLLQQIIALGLLLPVEEFRFHPTRRWRWDLAWPERMLAVEVQGGTWTNGTHNRGRGYDRDCEKLNEGQLLGWRVLWVTTDMVVDGRALDMIRRALRRRWGCHCPQSPLRMLRN